LVRDSTQLYPGEGSGGACYVYAHGGGIRQQNLAAAFLRRIPMKRLLILAAGAAAIALTTTAPAEAVVYCKTVGVPKGCVVRPAAVVVRPAAVGVAVRPRSAVNLGGPVNRVGVR
jgi:hypothetical protein